MSTLLKVATIAITYVSLFLKNLSYIDIEVDQKKTLTTL